MAVYTALWNSVLTAGLVLACGVPMVYSADLEFTNTELPWAIVNRTYSPPPLVIRSRDQCPGGGIGFAVVSGELPDHLHLSPAGYFSGKPVQRGTFFFTIRASDGCTWTARLFSLVVENPPELFLSPDKVRMTASAGQEASQTVDVYCSWPKLPIRVTVSEDWLEALPVLGTPAPRPEGPAQDRIQLRARTGSKKPGTYRAIVQVTAWEASPARLNVELVVQ